MHKLNNPTLIGWGCSIQEYHHRGQFLLFNCRTIAYFLTKLELTVISRDGDDWSAFRPEIQLQIEEDNLFKYDTRK